MFVIFSIEKIWVWLLFRFYIGKSTFEEKGIKVVDNLVERAQKARKMC